MDRLIYTAMTGAQHALEQQATIANNLANASTVGFRAQLSTYRAVPVTGAAGEPQTRAFVTDSTPVAVLEAGPLQQTGRELDIAIHGTGWISVIGRDGQEAYTRAGSLQVDANGELRTSSGLSVVGAGGAIVAPENTSVSISRNGGVTAVSRDGGNPPAFMPLDQLKIADLPAAEMRRGDDGLFRMADGGPAPALAEPVVLSGVLEGSNVNSVSAMVEMIKNARRFESQMKILSTADSNDQRSVQLLRVD